MSVGNESNEDNVVIFVSQLGALVSATVSVCLMFVHLLELYTGIDLLWGNKHFLYPTGQGTAFLGIAFCSNWLLVVAVREAFPNISEKKNMIIVVVFFIIFTSMPIWI